MNVRVVARCALLSIIAIPVFVARAQAPAAAPRPLDDALAKAFEMLKS